MGGDQHKAQGLEGHSGAHGCPLAAVGGTNGGTRVGAVERGEVVGFGGFSVELEGCYYPADRPGATLPIVCPATPNPSLCPGVDTGPFPWSRGATKGFFYLGHTL